MAKFNLEHKKPFITSKILSNEKSQRILDEIGLGGESIDILYNMAVDELDFNPKMVNKLGISKAVFDYNRGKNIGLMDSLGLAIMDRYGVYPHKASYKEMPLDEFLEGYDVSNEKLLDLVKRFDKEYSVYSDEGLNFINKVIDRNLFNYKNLKNLFQEKYNSRYRGE